VAWVLGLKKWLKSRGRWHKTGNFGQQSLAGKPMRATLGPGRSLAHSMGDYGLRGPEQ